MCVKENKKFNIYYRDPSTSQLPSEPASKLSCPCSSKCLSHRPRLCCDTEASPALSRGRLPPFSPSGSACPPARSTAAQGLGVGPQDPALGLGTEVLALLSGCVAEHPLGVSPITPVPGDHRQPELWSRRHVTLAALDRQLVGA